MVLLLALLLRPFVARFPVLGKNAVVSRSPCACPTSRNDPPYRRPRRISGGELLFGSSQNCLRRTLHPVFVARVGHTNLSSSQKLSSSHTVGHTKPSHAHTPNCLGETLTSTESFSLGSPTFFPTNPLELLLSSMSSFPPQPPPRNFSKQKGSNTMALFPRLSSADKCFQLHTCSDCRIGPRGSSTRERRRTHASSLATFEPDLPINPVFAFSDMEQHDEFSAWMWALEYCYANVDAPNPFAFVGPLGFMQSAQSRRFLETLVRIAYRDEIAEVLRASETRIEGSSLSSVGAATSLEARATGGDLKTGPFQHKNLGELFERYDELFLKRYILELHSLFSDGASAGRGGGASENDANDVVGEDLGGTLTFLVTRDDDLLQLAKESGCEFDGGRIHLELHLVPPKLPPEDRRTCAGPWELMRSGSF